MVVLPLMLIAVSAVPSARCEKVYEKILPRLQKEWARSPTPVATQLGKHIDKLRRLFLGECSKLSPTDLDCAEGKGNPEGEAECKKLEPQLRDECVKGVRSEKDNPMACKKIVATVDVAGKAWAKGLQDEPAIQEAKAETVGMWPKEGVKAFVESCVSSTRTPTAASREYCECISAQAQARMSWNEYSRVTASEKEGKPVNAATIEKMALIYSLCGGK